MKNYRFYGSFLLVWNKTAHFWNIHRFSSNAGQFSSGCGSFLLPIGGDSFPILPAIEFSSIGKFETYREISRILPVFGELMLYSRKMILDLKKKSQFQKKKIYIPAIILVAKIANFADIRWNNSIFRKREKSVHFKTISCEKSRILHRFLTKMVAYVRKKSCMYFKLTSRKILNATVYFDFWWFLAKE